VQNNNKYSGSEAKENTHDSETVKDKPPFITRAVG
jgi:hypothetical protein